MGLDAYVFCDCFEKGRLRTPPPVGVSLQVAPDGRLDYEGSLASLDDEIAFDRWLFKLACEHENGVLLHHRLGNIALIGLLRSELAREPQRFPILLTRVLYSGTHGGDCLAVEMISSLQHELEALADFRCTDRKTKQHVDYFRSQMTELAAAAVATGKPIVF